MTLPESARLGTCHKIAWNLGADHQIAVAYDNQAAVLDLVCLHEHAQIIAPGRHLAERVSGCLRRGRRSDH